MADLAVVRGHSGPFRVILVRDVGGAGGGCPVTISWIAKDSPASTGDSQLTMTGIYSLKKAKMVYQALQEGMTRGGTSGSAYGADYRHAQNAVRALAERLSLDSQIDIENGDLSF